MKPIEYVVKVNEYGDKSWLINGKYHREDGPASEYANGDKFWYHNGKELTEQEFNARKKIVKLQDKG